MLVRHLSRTVVGGSELGTEENRVLSSSVVCEYVGLVLGRAVLSESLDGQKGKDLISDKPCVRQSRIIKVENQ